jgi:RHS repeat-associated protein
MKDLWDWNSSEVKFGHDQDSNLTSEVFPTTNSGGTTVAYSFDNSNNLTDTTVTDSAIWTTSPYQDDLTHLTLNADELIGTTSSSGGSPVTLGYDPLTRLTSGIDGSTYSYNAQNELTSSTTSGLTTNYASNTDSELCDTTPGSSASCSSPASGSTLYGYDATGDRCFSYAGTTTSYTCGTLPTSSTLQTYGWDQAGDLVCSTAANNHSPSYTCGNQNSAFTTTYQYNGDGLRTADQPEGGSSQDFVWNILGSTPQLIEDGSYYYLYGPDTSTPVEQIKASTGTASYLLSDNQGVRYVVGPAGAEKGAASYGSYGSKIGSLGTAFAFAGGYTDSDGLIYLINRYYDPSSAQFLSPDSLQSVTGNSYGYGGDDPSNSTDPSGRIPVFTDGGAGSGPPSAALAATEEVFAALRLAAAQYNAQVANEAEKSLQANECNGLISCLGLTAWKTLRNPIAQGAITAGVCTFTAGSGCAIANYGFAALNTACYVADNGFSWKAVVYGFVNFLTATVFKFYGFKTLEGSAVAKVDQYDNEVLISIATKTGFNAAASLQIKVVLRNIAVASTGEGTIYGVQVGLG